MKRVRLESQLRLVLCEVKEETPVERYDFKSLEASFKGLNGSLQIEKSVETVVDSQ